MRTKIAFNNYILFSIFLSIAFISIEASAQKKNHGIENKELQKKLKTGDVLFEEKSYYNATEYYQLVLKGDQENEYVLYKLGLSFFKSRDYLNSEIQLGKIYEWKKNKTAYPSAIFYYAQSLKSLGKYEEAKKAFLLYTKLKSKEKEEKYLKSIVKNEIRSCEYAYSMVVFDTINNIKISPLRGKINNAYSDFSPKRVNENLIVFSSIRSDSVLYVDYDAIHTNPVKLFTSTKDDEGWKEPQELKQFNHPYDNTANGVYSRDKQFFYFTRCKPDKNLEQVCKIYFSKLNNGSWSKAKKLNKGINQKGSSSTQPALGTIYKTVARKKKEYAVLYFVSNRKGGKGKNDIWFSQTNDKGEFTKPVNCGTKINTIGNEITPFYDEEKNKLFFSSDYHLNAGGFDVFKSTGSLARWEKPQNLSLAINSSYDDTYYVPANSASPGLLVTNRPSGTALKSESCCDDIVEVEYFTPPSNSITGVIKPVNEIKGIVLSNVSVGIVPTGKIAYHLKQYKSLRNLKDSIQWISVSDSSGVFNLETSKTKNYSLIFAKDNFDIRTFPIDSAITSNHSNHIFLSDLTDTTLNSFAERNISSIKNDISSENEKISTFESAIKGEISEGEVYILDKVNFDTDKFIINKQSEKAIESLFNFLKNNPTLKIEIAGHTDNQGSEEHNLQLSEKRANTIKDYLIKKGIHKKRIIALGYGESEPIASNENPDGSDNPEGRKINRRTEIKILEKNEE